MIVTCRHQSQGGHFKGSEDERRSILSDALALGAEYVDLEWRESCASLMEQTGGRRVILSHHDFNGVPADLDALSREMLSSGAEMVKLAVTAHSLSDTLRLRAIGRNTRVPVLLIAMGEAGIASRVLASWMGSAWTYAGDGVAPGQISQQRLQDEFGFRRIGARTAIYGVLGKPISHSVSPAMHNAAFRALNLDAVYLPLAAADFADFKRFADAVELSGASVTAPFKVDAFESADECDPVSRRIQSVNTLRNEGSKMARLQYRCRPVSCRRSNPRCGCRAPGPRCSAQAERHGRCQWRSHPPACASRSPRAGSNRRSRWRH